jgi:hypothetical protein
VHLKTAQDFVAADEKEDAKKPLLMTSLPTKTLPPGTVLSAKDFKK